MQCLCPSRHCLLAIAYEEGGDLTPESASKGLKALVEINCQQGLMNPWCGICGSRDLKYEDGVTRYQSIEEAKPHLEETERLNALANMVLRKF